MRSHRKEKENEGGCGESEYCGKEREQMSGRVEMRQRGNRVGRK